LAQLQQGINVPLDRGARCHAPHRHLGVACKVPGAPGLVDEPGNPALRKLVERPLGRLPSCRRTEQYPARNPGHDPLVRVHHGPRDPHVHRPSVGSERRRQPVHGRRVRQRLPGDELPADIQRPELGHGRLPASVVGLDEGAAYGAVGVPLQRLGHGLDGGPQVADRGELQLRPPR
jgi:hypothetical protein